MCGCCNSNAKRRGGWKSIALASAIELVLPPSPMMMARKRNRGVLSLSLCLDQELLFNPLILFQNVHPPTPASFTSIQKAAALQTSACS